MSRWLWPALRAAMVVLALAAVFTWWRGGMWIDGEMPTYGMQLTLLGCAGAIVFSLLHDWLGRRERRAASRGRARARDPEKPEVP